jgi:hypothetical protein
MGHAPQTRSTSGPETVAAVEPPTPPAAPAKPVQDIRLQLGGEHHPPVQLRFVEKGGEITVAVRTPDTGLRDDLRDHLAQLAGRLERSGYATETWRPSAAADARNDLPPRGQAAPDSGQHSSGGDDTRRQSEGRQQHPQPQEARPHWVEELEDARRNSSFSWHAPYIP